MNERDGEGLSPGGRESGGEGGRKGRACPQGNMSPGKYPRKYAFGIIVAVKEGERE